MEKLLSTKGLEIKRKVDELHQQIEGSKLGTDSFCYHVPAENMKWAEDRNEFAAELIKREEFESDITVNEFLEMIKTQVSSPKYEQIEYLLLSTWQYFDEVHHICA